MNRSMHMPERDFERALGALLKVDAAAGRLSRDPWDAVAPRLGSQRSRRPWEYVMDAINKPRMPFNKQYIYTAGGALVVVIAALLLVLLLNTDDGTSGQSAPAAPSGQVLPENPPLQLSVVIPAVEPAAGSDEAAILEVFDRVVRAVNVEDWEATVETCDPGRAHMTAAQAELIINIDYLRSHDSLAGLNFRNVTVRIFDDRTALTESDEYELDRPVYSEPVQHSWHAVDGVWYSDTFCSMTGS